jgi:hypothetical protein
MSTTRYIVDNQSEQTINNEPILRPYKVFTALLTQNGASSSLPLMNDPLTIGVTYEIEDNGGPGWDFTNVGSPDNEIGTKFIATGTTPISWSGARLISNEGAPTVIILENSIGNVWFEYSDIGAYQINSINKFLTGQTTLLVGPLNNLDTNGPLIYYEPSDSSRMLLKLFDGTLDPIDGIGSSLLIEIRVYNNELPV